MLIKDSDDRVIVRLHLDEENLFSEAEDQICAYLSSTTGDLARIHYSKEKSDRAAAAWELHSKLGHSSREMLSSALDHNELQDVFLTSKCLTAAYDIYVSCDVCVEGKMIAPSEQTFKSALAPSLSMDFFFFLVLTTGGNFLTIIGRDECSSFTLKASSKNRKGEPVPACLMTFLSYLTTFGHNCASIVFDNKAVFVSVRAPLGHEGVEAVYLPSDLYNKRAERAIRHIKERERTMLCELPYALSAMLNGGLLDADIVSTNSMPDTRFGTSVSPYQLVTARRPKARHHSFGAISMCYPLSADSPNDRSEWGIYLDYADNATSNFRVYIALRSQVVSRRKFVESSEAAPADWKFALKLVNKVANLRSMLDPAVKTQTIDTAAALSPAPAPVSEIAASPVVNNDHTAVETSAPPTTPARQQPPTLAVVTPSGASDLDNSRAVTLARDPVVSQTPLNHRSIRISDERRANFSFLKTFASIHERAQVDSQLKDIVITALKLSVHKALDHLDSRMRDKCPDAISKELRMLWNVKTFQPVHKRTIATPNLTRVYPCHVFLKQKSLANRDFDKDMPRLVYEGDWVEPGTVGKTSSPTVSTMSVMMILNIAAVMKYEVSTHDVTGDLIAPEHIVGERPMYVWPDRELSTMFVAMVPVLKSFVDESTGTIYFRIMRYLYDLPQTSFHFYNQMDATLKEIGFRRLLGDSCGYVEGGNDTTRVIIAVHDHLVVGTKVSRERFQYEIEHEYVLTSHCETNLSYIELDGIASPTNISVSQVGYLADMLDKFQLVIGQYRGAARTPGSSSPTTLLAPTADEGDRPPEGETRLTQACVLFATTYLVSRSHNPTMDFLVADAQVLKYLRSTQDQAVVFKGGNEIKGIAISVHCDMSRGTHVDGKGHGGILVTMGSGYFHARSTKVKTITPSSTETVQYVMCDATTYALLGKAMLKTFGPYNVTKPCRMYQDNSAATGTTRRNLTFVRIKRIMSRSNLVREAVERGDIKWYFRRTHNLAPDMLTKCLLRATMLSHIAEMGMRDIQPEEGKE
jgi:hypothetical protein